MEMRESLSYKGKAGKDYFLYAGCGKGQVLKIEENLEFASIFRWKDCGLYDLREPLRKLLGIPDGFGFPEKADALKETEEIANRKALLLIRQTGARSFRKPSVKM